MRIALIGQAAFGAESLKRLHANGHEVAAVYAPPDRAGTRPDPLKTNAESLRIPVYQPSTFRDEKVFEQFASLKPELVVLAFVTMIVPARYFDAASKGAICYHPSLLPRHRGASAINWAIIMGDKRTGLTIFWADEGIDTGPVLLQKEVEIGADDTTGSIYFERLFPMGVDAIDEAVSMISMGTAQSIPQDYTLATYEPPCTDKVAAVQWQKPAQIIYNLIRGCDPQPGAFSFWNGTKVKFYETKLRDFGSDDVEPGTVTMLGSEGMEVSVPGGRLLITRVRTEQTGKMAPHAWAEQAGMKVGDRFA